MIENFQFKISQEHRQILQKYLKAKPLLYGLDPRDEKDVEAWMIMIPLLITQ